MPVKTGRLASEIKSEKVRWLWRDRIPRAFTTLIAGRPGGFKSVFTAHLAADVTRAGTHVLISASENPDSYVTRPRLEAAGAILERVHVRRFYMPRDLESIEEMIVEHNIGLVLIDPLAGHIAGVSRYSESIRAVMDPMADMAERTDCAFVITEHVLKNVGPKSDPLRAIAGSGSGAPAAAQMVYIMGKDPGDEDHIVLCNVKHNLSAKPDALEFDAEIVDVPGADTQALLTYVGETKFDARLLLGGLVPGGDAPPTKLDAAREWLIDYLLIQPDNTSLVTFIYAAGVADGHTRKTISRAGDELKVVKNPPGGGRNCKWTLPRKLLDSLGGNGG